MVATLTKMDGIDLASGEGQWIVVMARAQAGMDYGTRVIIWAPELKYAVRYMRY